MEKVQGTRFQSAIDIIAAIRGLESCGLRVPHFNLLSSIGLLKWHGLLSKNNFLLGFTTTYSLFVHCLDLLGNEFASETVKHFYGPSIVVNLPFSVIFLSDEIFVHVNYPLI